MCALNNYVDEISFSQSAYEVFEDNGSLCIELTLDKPELSVITVHVDESEVNATSKLYDYTNHSYNYFENAHVAQFIKLVLNSYSMK